MESATLPSCFGVIFIQQEQIIWWWWMLSKPEISLHWNICQNPFLLTQRKPQFQPNIVYLGPDGVFLQTLMGLISQRPHYERSCSKLEVEWLIKCKPDFFQVTKLWSKTVLPESVSTNASLGLNPPPPPQPLLESWFKGPRIEEKIIELTTLP